MWYFRDKGLPFYSKLIPSCFLPKYIIRRFQSKLQCLFLQMHDRTTWSQPDFRSLELTSNLSHRFDNAAANWGYSGTQRHQQHSVQHCSVSMMINSCKPCDLSQGLTLCFLTWKALRKWTQGGIFHLCLKTNLRKYTNGAGLTFHLHQNAVVGASTRSQFIRC